MMGGELVEGFIVSKHVYSDKHNNKIRGKIKNLHLLENPMSSYRQGENGEIRMKAEEYRDVERLQ